MPETEQALSLTYMYEPPHDKTNKMAWAASEDSDQTGRTVILLGLSWGGSFVSNLVKSPQIQRQHLDMTFILLTGILNNESISQPNVTRIYDL